MPITVLGRTAAALAADMSDQLRLVADELIGLVENGAVEYISPLLAVGDALATRYNHIGAAVDAARSAAEHAPPGSVLEQQAVASWAKHVDTLAMWWNVGAAISTSRSVAEHAPPGTVRENQAVATWAKHLDNLATWDIAAAIESARSTARWAKSDSGLEQGAVACWAKYVDSLVDRDVAAAFVKRASHYANADSVLAQQASAALQSLNSRLHTLTS